MDKVGDALACPLRRSRTFTTGC